MSEYDKKTGDGKWLEQAEKILRESIKEHEADSPAEPHTTMRSGDGADRSGLRPENCRR